MPILSRSGYYVLKWSGGPLGPLVGFGAQLASNILNSGQQDKQNRFNAEQARLQRQFQSEMMDKQNRYNDPSSVMSRLKSAGLNPNLAYGEIGTPSASPGQGASASSSGMVPLGFNSSTLMDIDRQISEIHNVQQDTEKKRAETDVLWTDAEFREEWNSSQIKLNYSHIFLNEATERYTDEEVKTIQPLIEKMSAESEEAHTRAEVNRQSVANLKQDEIGKLLENIFSQNTLDMRIHKLQKEIEAVDASINLSRAEAMRICMLAPLEAAGIKADTVLKYSQSINLSYQDQRILSEISKNQAQEILFGSMSGYFDAQSDSITWNLENDKKFRSVERSLGIAKTIQSFWLDSQNMVFNALSTITGGGPLRASGPKGSFRPVM